mmetsp:Transcript_32703/g.65219  ORF Transcript_32703/g.65219 Transcript_32703/m.65219 type:complete len:419 (+) Transcript_32703:157-1413(+)
MAFHLATSLSALFTTAPFTSPLAEEAAATRFPSFRTAFPIPHSRSKRVDTDRSSHLEDSKFETRGQSPWDAAVSSSSSTRSARFTSRPTDWSAVTAPPVACCCGGGGGACAAAVVVVIEAYSEEEEDVEKGGAELSPVLADDDEGDDGDGGEKVPWAVPPAERVKVGAPALPASWCAPVAAAATTIVLLVGLRRGAPLYFPASSATVAAASRLTRSSTTAGGSGGAASVALSETATPLSPADPSTAAAGSISPPSFGSSFLALPLPPPPPPPSPSPACSSFVLTGASPLDVSTFSTTSALTPCPSSLVALPQSSSSSSSFMGELTLLLLLLLSPPPPIASSPPPTVSLTTSLVEAICCFHHAFPFRLYAPTTLLPAALASPLPPASFIEEGAAAAAAASTSSLAHLQRSGATWVMPGP